MPLPPVPSDVCEFSWAVQIGPGTPTFAFWILIPGAASAGPSWAQSAIDSFIITPMQAFLDCMHTDAIFQTCRLTVGGSTGFRYVTPIAPNHGAGTAGQAPALAGGLYVQTLGGGRGSGSRIRIPGIANELTTNFYWLSTYGLQQLTFAADALTSWSAGPIGPSGGPGVLGTVRRRTAAGPLAIAQWDPASVVRPTLELDVLASRQKAIRGLSV